MGRVRILVEFVYIPLGKGRNPSLLPQDMAKELDRLGSLVEKKTIQNQPGGGWPPSRHSTSATAVVHVVSLRP